MNNMIIDCFAGGGGASVGIEMALGRPVDIAINHDPEAIRMHAVNHPRTIHLKEDIFKVDLKKYVGDTHVSLMWASPDCTSHSKAKGGQPRENRLRILPWAVYKHAKDILPDVLIMENVEEIQKWGPLDENGYPIREREGEDYNKFIQSMKDLGYDFDCRELVAADYGAPTTRKRWYAIFRRDGLPIIWPTQTHSRHRILGLEPWEECGRYIDWSDLGTSIFGRKKPLAEATQKRIALYEWLLNKYAKPGDIILDTHVGSASSLIACHNTNHKYVGFEIDPEYYRLAKERLDRETAQMNIFDFLNPYTDDQIDGQIKIMEILKNGI